MTAPILSVQHLERRYGARIGCTDIFAAQARAIA